MHHISVNLFHQGKYFVLIKSSLEILFSYEQTWLYVHTLLQSLQFSNLQPLPIEISFNNFLLIS